MSTSRTGINLEERNGMWKGIDVGYGALHIWVTSRLKRPPVCPSCGQNKTIELSNISGEYKRDLSDWEWICRKCHMVQDGRLNLLISLEKSHFKGLDGRFIPKERWNIENGGN